MKKFEFVHKKLDINEVEISIQKENADEAAKNRVQNDAKIISVKETQQQDLGDNIKRKELRFKFAAIVLDRLFFYLALFYALITFAGLLLSIPNFYN
jgi:hypothetical protein